MDAIEQLMQEAAAKRDATISAAHEEYRDTVQQIKRLKGTMEGKPFKGRRTIDVAKHLLAVAPDDRDFSVDDLTVWVNKEYPHLQVKKSVVRTTVWRLVREDKMQQTQSGKGNRKAMFAVAEFETPVSPFGDETQIRLAEEILRDAAKPLSGVEIVVRMKERGLPVEDPEGKLKSVANAMRSHPEVFRNLGDGIWEINDERT